MFKGATDDMIRYLSNENVTMNNHRYCVTLEVRLTVDVSFICLC